MLTALSMAQSYEESSAHNIWTLQAVVTFSGPEEESLSGIALESGSVLERLTDSFSILHGQATAALG